MSGVVCLLLLILAGVVFLGGLGQRDIVTSHEARVAQTARTMAEAGWPWQAKPVAVPSPKLIEENGEKRFRDSAESITVNPWIVPVLNQRIRMNKPPLPYWCSAIAFRALGVSEFSARLPTAILGVFATLLMLHIGTHLLGRREGIIAAMLWLSTYFIVDEFRKSMADPYLAFFTLLAISTFLRGGSWTILCYVALALGTLAKGPIIFLTTLPAMILLTQTWNLNLPGILRHTIGIAIMFAIALPWPLAVMRHVPNAAELWLYDAFESVEKARPIYFYFLNLFQLTLPWTPFWVVGAVLPFLHRVRGTRSSMRWRILLWAMFIVICFSIKPVKKNAYLLPVMPVLILITADAISVLLRSARRFPKAQLSWALMTLCAVIGIGFACAIGGFAVRNYPSKSIAIVAAVLAITAGVIPLIAIVRSRSGDWFISQAAGFGVIMVLFLSIWDPLKQNARSPRFMAENVLNWSRREAIPIATGPSPEEFSFYLPTNLPDWRSANQVLLVLDRPSKEELGDHKYIQARFPHGIVTSWGTVLRDSRYVVVEVLLNRDRM